MNKIRIAWWDRKELTYDYGCWQTRENLQEMEDWNEKQNILYPHVFYWIEEGNEVNDNQVVNLKKERKNIKINDECYIILEKDFTQ